MAMKPPSSASSASASAAGGSLSAGALREAFDHSFTQAANQALAGAASEDYLAIRVAGNAQLLRLAEVASLLPLRSVTRLPSPLPSLLGIAGYRGGIVPVYDLGALLGYPPATRADAPPRWMAIAAAQPVGLAFETFDGHLRPHARELGDATAAAEGGDAAAPEVQAHAAAPTLLTLDGKPRPLLSVALLLATIHDLAQALPAHKEL